MIDFLHRLRKPKSVEPEQDQILKEQNLKTESNPVPDSNAKDYNFKKALLCPHCNDLLEYPMLCIFSEYPCYRCKEKITTGTWAMPILEKGIIVSLLEQDPNLPPEARDMMLKSGIKLTFSYSSTAGLKYWMQTCPHCQAKQGDFHVSGYLIKAMHYPELMKQKQADFPYCSNCEKVIVEKNSITASCIACGKIVSEKVTNYCLDRPNIFKGKIYCYQCQRTVNFPTSPKQETPDK